VGSSPTPGASGRRSRADFGIALTQDFSTGARVYVEIDGERVEGIYIRAGELEAPGREEPSKRKVAWVRRSDTGEVEPFDHRLVSAG
jgi:hypothetical protein